MKRKLIAEENFIWRVTFTASHIDREENTMSVRILSEDKKTEIKINVPLEIIGELFFTQLEDDKRHLSKVKILRYDS